MPDEVKNFSFTELLVTLNDFYLTADCALWRVAKVTIRPMSNNHFTTKVLVEIQNRHIVKDPKCDIQ